MKPIREESATEVRKKKIKIRKEGLKKRETFL